MVRPLLDYRVDIKICSIHSVHGGVSWLRGGSGSLSILGSELLRGVSPPARLGGTAEEGTSAERPGGATPAAEQVAEANKSGAGPLRVAAVPAHEAASNVSEGTLVRGDDLITTFGWLLCRKPGASHPAPIAVLRAGVCCPAGCVAGMPKAFAELALERRHVAWLPRDSERSSHSTCCCRPGSTLLTTVA